MTKSRLPERVGAASRTGVRFMFRARCRRTLAMTALLILLTACAAAPLQEMSDARQALSAARDVDAQRHAPTQLQRAQARLATAERTLMDEEIDFDKTRADAVAAKEEAIKARMIAIAISAARNALHDARALHVNADRAQETLQRALTAAEEGEVNSALKYARLAERLATEAIAGPAVVP